MGSDRLLRASERLAAVAAFVLFLADGGRAQSPIAQADPPLRIASGQILGKRVGPALDVRACLGIPFATPPVGELRWRPPQPPAPWDGVRECTRIGSACPQPPSPFAAIGGGSEPQSEDCLYLNVWTPAQQPDARLPVMVWIHGGGFFLGSGGGTGYDGANLARRQVVVVTINYRLGPFGFLGHPALSKESEHGVSGNYGLLDQIEALRWVQLNIAAFGGDPGNVTIFGESAGAFSVGCLLASPLAKGLFERAIAQSGAAVWITGRLEERGLEESAEATGTRVLAQLAGDAPDLLAAARAKTAAEVLAVAKPGLHIGGSEGGSDGGDTNSFGPVADGWVIPDEPWRLFQAGKVHRVPFLTGTNADEGTMFALQGAPATREQQTAGMRAIYGALAEKLLAHYSLERCGSVSAVHAELLGDSIFVAPTRAQVRALADAGARCFLYHFTRTARGRKSPLGVAHAAEISYVFGDLDDSGPLAPYDAVDRKLSDLMMDYWVQFARTGDPNRDGLPKWPEYSPEEDAHLELGTEVRPGDGLHAEACDLWQEVVEGWRKLARR